MSGVASAGRGEKRDPVDADSAFRSGQLVPVA